MKYNFENIVLSGRYELIQEIGSGGMAFVYKAMDTRLNRHVAVKILKTEFTNNKDFVQRFSYEAMSAASITHPNIVSIYDAGYDNDLFYIVMELIEGITLKELIDKKTISWKDALIVTKQILSALDIAHKNNIVHRDIKPHNIMLTREGIAKVADFGIAKVMSGNTQEVKEANIGSVHYISPEQAKGEQFDERVDIYSLGITLFEMLTGNVPFDGDTAVAVAMKNVKEPLPVPCDINPNIPIGVSDFIIKATMKEPEERFQSAVDMMSSLQVVMMIPNERLDYSSNYVKSKSGVSSSKNGNNRGKKTFAGYLKNNFRELIVTIIAFVTSITVFSVSFSGISGAMKEYRVVRYEVADFKNQNYKEVFVKLKQLGLEVVVEYEVSEVSRDLIISQSPVAGEYLTPIIDENSDNKEDSTITFRVSIGEKDFVLGDYSGGTTDYREVVNELKNIGINIKHIDMYNPDVKKDYVIATRPGAGEILNKGDTLYIYRSLGSVNPAIVKVDSYVGLTEEQAKAMISADYVVEVKEAIIEVPETVEPTEEEWNPNPTVPPLPTDTPVPTITPTPEPPKIEGQYPPKGTILNKGDKITLYMSVSEKYRTTKKIVLKREDDMNLNNTFELKIECTPNDTGVKELITQEGWFRDRMPYVFEVPVPYRGESVVNVYINGELYCRYIVKE